MLFVYENKGVVIREQKAGVGFNSTEDIYNPGFLSLEFLSQCLGTGRIENKFQRCFLVFISSLLLYFLGTNFTINEEKDQNTFSRRICS